MRYPCPAWRRREIEEREAAIRTRQREALMYLPRQRVEQIAEVLDYLLQSVPLMPCHRTSADGNRIAEARVLRDELRELLAPSPYEGRE